MPYDAALDEQTIAQMRAEMLRRFDDGASLLGQDPDMLQVGLFGRVPKKPAPPIDLSRRSVMGLPEIPIPMAGESTGQLVPKPTDVPQPSTLPPPPAAPQQQSAPQQQPASPLGQLANKALNAPMTRREVLQRAGQAALQQALPTPKVANVVKSVAAPKAEAIVPKAASDAYLGAIGLLKDAIQWKFQSGHYAPSLISQIENYLPYVDPVKMSNERRDEIASLLKQFKEVATLPEEAHKPFRALLTTAMNDIINATPAESFVQSIKDLYAPTSLNTWELFNAISDADLRPKEIKNLLKTLNIPYDPQDFKDWLTGAHY